MNLKALIFFLLFILAPAYAKAENQFDILINEIAWMGTKSSSNDEWIELKNNTKLQIDLNGWVLQTADEKIKINLTGVIQPKGFYLLERTDNQSVPEIQADQIYNGAINNNGQDVWLYDTKNNLIDEANFTDKWPAGNNETKQTMERINSNSWQTSREPGGTPRQENSEITVIDTQTDISVINDKFGYPSGIFINEIMPNPEGSDETEEWIEIYNSNNEGFDLFGWKIQDSTGTKGNFLINKKILANEYLLFKRQETKITLNNDKDTIKLILPNGDIEDSVSYNKSILGQSYNKTSSGWQWSKTPTPESPNKIVITDGDEDLPKIEKSDKNNNIDTDSLIADLSQNTTPVANKILDGTNPWFLFVIALAITAISVTVLLFIKIKIKKTNVRT